MKSTPLSHPSPELLAETVDGILFSAPMVLALLAGRKTVTRRTSTKWLKRKVGDLLFVRETWKESTYLCAEEPQADDHECSAHCKQRYIYYRATPRVGMRPEPDRARIRYLDESTPLTAFYETGWRSAMHLRRQDSRLVLRVTEPPRVERVNAITEEDAAREGVVPTPYDPEGDCWATGKHLTAFEYLWNELHGWAPNSFNEVNPEVVRIPFEIVDASLEAEQVGKGTA